MAYKTIKELRAWLLDVPDDWFVVIRGMNYDFNLIVAEAVPFVETAADGTMIVHQTREFRCQ